MLSVLTKVKVLLENKRRRPLLIEREIHVHMHVKMNFHFTLHMATKCNLFHISFTPIRRGLLKEQHWQLQQNVEDIFYIQQKET